MMLFNTVREKKLKAVSIIREKVSTNVIPEGVSFLSRRHIFWTAMLLDIPDIEGNDMHGIKSLASQIGSEMD
nr:hypothetical protein [Tanacetum cinerariifolium]